MENTLTTRVAKTKFKLVRKIEDVEYMLPELKLKQWIEIVSFLNYASKKHNAEAIVSLTVLDGEWVVLPWQQEPRGNLHVKFDISSERNQELLRNVGFYAEEDEEIAMDKVHCTIHSHNKSSAFQSSDDEEDEMDKNGWHVTLGDFDKSSLSSHIRLNIKDNAVFEDGEKKMEAIQEFLDMPITTIIEDIELSNEGLMACQESLKETFLHHPWDEEFPDWWKDQIVKPKYKPYSPRKKYELPGREGVLKAYQGYDSGSQQDQDDYWEAAAEATTAFNTI
jgi:hypothetical protein